MTPERIAELRALCEASTPGPWAATCLPSERHLPAGSVDDAVVVDAEDEQVADCLDNRAAPSQRCQADARFIAAARTALPEALDEIERLRAELANLPPCPVCR